MMASSGYATTARMGSALLTAAKSAVVSGTDASRGPPVQSDLGRVVSQRVPLRCVVSSARTRLNGSDGSQRRAHAAA